MGGGRDEKDEEKAEGECSDWREGNGNRMRWAGKEGGGGVSNAVGEGEEDEGEEDAGGGAAMPDASAVKADDGGQVVEHTSHRQPQQQAQASTARHLLESMRAPPPLTTAPAVRAGFEETKVCRALEETGVSDKLPAARPGGGRGSSSEGGRGAASKGTGSRASALSLSALTMHLHLPPPAETEMQAAQQDASAAPAEIGRADGGVASRQHLGAQPSLSCYAAQSGCRKHAGGALGLAAQTAAAEGDAGADADAGSKRAILRGPVDPRPRPRGRKGQEMMAGMRVVMAASDKRAVLE